MRTGNDYIEALRSSPRGVFLDGRRVEDVTEHPGFRGAVRTVASLFDYAADPANEMTYTAPETGGAANRVFMIPRSREDLRMRREAIQRWAGITHGFIGRGPEHVGSFFAGFAAAADVFGGADGRDFSEHVRAFQRRILDESLYVAYTIVPPQFDRGSSAGDWDTEFVQAGVVEETDEGVIVRGSMALGTAAPLADYLFVSCIKPLGPGETRYANSFVVPLDAPGLQIICRRAYGGDRDPYDYPLSSRFDESDGFAIFEDVLVPWEHVFALKDPDTLRAQFFRTPAHVLGNAQAQIRFATKLRFVIGAARKITAVNGIDKLPPVQDRLGELASLASIVEGMTLAAEASSSPDEFGVERPNPRFLYGAMAQQAELYPRVIQILRDLAGVGVLQVPASTADFASEETRPAIERYIRSPSAGAAERVKLFKMAWELVGSEFAGRHQQYELFYAGAPFVVRGYAFRNYGWDEAVETVEGFLAGYGLPDGGAATAPAGDGSSMAVS